MEGDALIIEHTTLFVNIRLDVTVPCFLLWKRKVLEK